MSTAETTVTEDDYESLPILDDVCFYTIGRSGFEFACQEMEEVSIRVMNCETRREAWQQVREMFELVAKKGALLAEHGSNGKLVFWMEENEGKAVEEIEESAATRP